MLFMTGLDIQIIQKSLATVLVLYSHNIWNAIGPQLSELIAYRHWVFDPTDCCIQNKKSAGHILPVVFVLSMGARQLNTRRGM